MNYENFALFLKRMQAGTINCESTWLGLIWNCVCMCTELKKGWEGGTESHKTDTVLGICIIHVRVCLHASDHDIMEINFRHKIFIFN